MSITRDDIAAMMKGIAPAVRDVVRQSIQPLSDRIVELTEDNNKLVQRVAVLEGRDPDQEAQRAVEQARR